MYINEWNTESNFVTKKSIQEHKPLRETQLSWSAFVARWILGYVAPVSKAKYSFRTGLVRGWTVN